MSTCTKWVDKIVIECKNWASQVDCECTSWADEGDYACEEWADEGSEECTSWEKCKWYTPWNCIGGFFCRAWYWVAKWVCKGWYWVAKWVCKAFAWVVKTVCVVFGWVIRLVCVAWDWLRCALLAFAKWIASLFGDRDAKPKIEHVFVLMLENRSFDHMLGFSRITGVGIDGNPTSIDGSDPTRDTNADPTTGNVFPVSTPAAFALKGVDADPGHEWRHVLRSLCGKDAVYNPVPGGYPPIDNSGYVHNYIDPTPGGSGGASPERAMHCFSPDQLPVLNALAREFAVCDKWFSSMPGPTFPNRFFLLAATSGGLDDSPSSFDIFTATTVEGFRFENGNFFDLLDQYCLKWRIYEGDQFPVSFALSGMNLNALQGRFTSFDEFDSKVNEVDFDEKFTFIEPKYGAHDFGVTGPGDFACGNSMHPLDDVTRGEALIKSVYETIRNSPHWNSSMLIVTFDEHGGFYDHVVPPAAVPPGDTVTASYVKKGFLFDQLGPRVPSLVISPYTPRGVIDHTVYDHTSMLATVERLYGMRNLTERDEAANDFVHLISLDQPRTDAPTTLPSVAVNPNPLDCDHDDDSEDVVLVRRAELRLARQRGVYREHRVEDVELTSTQIGFMQVALLRVLLDAEYPERQQWIDRYRAVATGVDAALFMTEARLKLQFGINVTKFGTDGERPRTRRRRSTPPPAQSD